MCKYGTRFLTVPRFKLNGENGFSTKNIWIVTSLMISVKPLWEVTYNHQFRKSHWHGWLLSYIPKTCANSIPRYQDKVFKWENIRSVVKVRRKLVGESLKEIFQDLDKVKCIDLMEPQTIEEGL